MLSKLKKLIAVFLLGAISLSLKPAFALADTVSLLSAPWQLTGNNSSSEKYQSVNSGILVGKDTLKITYDLRGVCLLGGDASAIIFDQPIGGSWRYISLSNYGKNCQNGEQTVDIPLSRFPGLDITKPVGTFHIRLWNRVSYTVDVKQVSLYSSQTPVSETPPAQTPIPVDGYNAQFWNLTGTFPQPVPSVTPTLTRTDAAINFDWGSLSPDAKITRDRFAARWTRTTSFDAGNFRFTTVSDDGIRLWIDGQLLIDQWNDHGPTTYTADKNLTAGNHTIKMEYYENGGGAVAKMSYAPVTATTPVTSPAPTPAPTTNGSWEIRSVSSMKETKDKICGQDSQSYINSWVDKAKELGANYVAVETPYDNPACASALSYTKVWVDTIRSRNLKVWHRHMPLAFEAIYDTPKVKGDYLAMIGNYIKNNAGLFAEGDIFTPIPEPQNGGIGKVTGCSNGICQYDNAAHFNRWLRDAIDTSASAFSAIGLSGKVKLGYYGFDGFVAWGSNNPDWHGILEDATVSKMGNITIDHYPELIGQTMKQGLDELQAKYPNTPIIIGEWGSAGSTNIEQQVLSSMGAAKRPGVVGFNYWHMGMGGNEALINGDFTNRAQFDEVQSYFLGTR